MCDIARMAGRSKATLWNHFESKRALFSAVIDQATASFRKELEGPAPILASLDETLAVYCATLIRKINSRDVVALERLVISEGGWCPAIGQMYWERGRKFVETRLADLLESHPESGKFDGVDAVRVAETLVSLCFAGEHERRLWGVTAGDDDVERDAARIVGFVLAAFGVAHARDWTAITPDPSSTLRIERPQNLDNPGGRGGSPGRRPDRMPRRVSST